MHGAVIVHLQTLAKILRFLPQNSCETVQHTHCRTSENHKVRVRSFGLITFWKRKFPSLTLFPPEKQVVWDSLTPVLG